MTRRAWFLAVLIAALCLVYVCWSRRPVGRFVPISGTPNLALDTVTGRLCWSYDPLGGQNGRVPLCRDGR